MSILLVLAGKTFLCHYFSHIDTIGRLPVIVDHHHFRTLSRLLILVKVLPTEPAQKARLASTEIAKKDDLVHVEPTRSLMQVLKLVITDLPLLPLIVLYSGRGTHVFVTCKCAHVRV